MYVCVYIYINISILFQILFHYSLLQDTEFSCLCYTVGPCYLFHISHCVFINPKFLIYFSISLHPFDEHSLFSLSLFLFRK